MQQFLFYGKKLKTFSVGWSLLQAVKQKYNYDEGLHSPSFALLGRGRKSSSAALSLNKYM